jgi:hypothetical protein
MPNCSCALKASRKIAHDPPEACDASIMHNGERVLCSEPGGHDGPHMACTIGEHPLTTWEGGDGE